MIIPLLKGCYPYFSLFAIVIMIWRIRTKRWTGQETIVALALLLHGTLEILQLWLGDGKFAMHRRYLLPVAPLFFVWTAYGMAEIYQYYKLRKYKKCLFIVIAISILLLLFDGARPSLCHRFSAKKGIEAQAARFAGEWIRADYRGPLQNSAARHPEMYHSPFLPTVQSPFPAIAYACNGRTGPSPFCDPPDYWVLPETAPAPEKSAAEYRFSVGKNHFVVYKRIVE